MSDYVLKKGEVLNGGYSVEIGSYTLRNIGGYAPSWNNVYDENSFTDWHGNTQKFLKGRQFSLKITTGPLDWEDYNSLVTALKNKSIEVSCPDFNGKCYCDNIPADLTQANFLSTRYKINFTLIAENIELFGNGL